MGAIGSRFRSLRPDNSKLSVNYLPSVAAEMFFINDLPLKWLSGIPRIEIVFVLDANIGDMVVTYTTRKALQNIVAGWRLWKFFQRLVISIAQFNFPGADFSPFTYGNNLGAENGPIGLHQRVLISGINFI